MDGRLGCGSFGGGWSASDTNLTPGPVSRVGDPENRDRVGVGVRLHRTGTFAIPDTLVKAQGENDPTTAAGSRSSHGVGVYSGANGVKPRE
jgi:hypothetical protein